MRSQIDRVSVDNNKESGVHKQFYNMKAVIQATGLNPVTIRTWERRYGLPNPHRSAGGHRQYTQRDIETFKWLMARQEEGLSVRHAVETWQTLEEQGEDPLVMMPALTLDPIPVQIPTESSNQIDGLRQQWIEAGLAFDREAAERAVTQALAYFPAEFVCIELLQKGIATVGQGWYQEEVSIQQEHFITALAVRRLEALVAATQQPVHSKRIMIFCAPDDNHIFGPLLLTFLLLRRGWDVLYLGASIPVQALNESVAQVDPALIIVSAQQLHTAANLLDVANILHEHSAMLGYGGRIFNHVEALQELIPGHFLGESLEIALGNVERLLSVNEKPQTSSKHARDTNYEQALQQYISRRTLIESHIWGTFIANNKAVDNLMQINAEFALTIMAALRLGSISLIGNDIGWVEDLLVSFRPKRAYVHNFLLAYHEAAKIHLGGSANIITEWLAEIVNNYAMVQSNNNGNCEVS